MQRFSTRDLTVTAFSDSEQALCEACTNPGTGCLESDAKERGGATDGDLNVLRRQLLGGDA